MTPLPISALREIGREAGADWRTVRRVLAGERVVGAVDGRVRIELARRGYRVPPPAVVTRSMLISIGAAADADPRTVRRVLAGERVRQAVAVRIRTALAQRGIMLPGEPKTPVTEHRTTGGAAA